MTKEEIRELIRREVRKGLEEAARSCLYRYNILNHLQGSIADSVWEVGRALESAAYDYADGEG